MFSGVLCLYPSIFHHLEEQGALDPLNELDILAFHIIFLPRTNQHIGIWKEGLNSYLMRRAGSLSPLQQYVNGMLRLRGSGLEVVREIFCHLDEASANSDSSMGTLRGP